MSIRIAMGDRSQRTPARRIRGTVAGLYHGLGSNFETTETERLDLGLDGILDDVHSGFTRKTGGREPWYPRGTEIRNERQISILSFPELTEIAGELGIPEVKPEWIGGNLVLGGIDRLTWLPPRTLLFFENGVTLKIDGDNAPCKLSGRSLVRRHPDRPDLEAGFVRAGRHRRGLVAWVEKPGQLETGEGFEARLPEQWIYD